MAESTRHGSGASRGTEASRGSLNENPVDEVDHIFSFSPSYSAAASFSNAAASQRFRWFNLPGVRASNATIWCLQDQARLLAAVANAGIDTNRHALRTIEIEDDEPVTLIEISLATALELVGFECRPL